MKTATKTKLIILSALLSAFSLQPVAFAQGTAFTYQGRLSANSTPANGSYDLAFTLFATNVTGTAVAGPVTNAAVSVSNGLFTTTVDFGAAFTGESNWLEIAVSTNGANAFSTLAPRQQLTPVPYALMAGNVSGTVGLSQLPSSLVTNGASGVTISGTFSGNGAGVTNVPGTIPWQSAGGTNLTAAANQGYLLTNNGLTIVTLPTTANAGDIVTVSGTGTNGWLAQVVPGQALAGGISGIYWIANTNGPNGPNFSPHPSCVASSADGSKLVVGTVDGPMYTSTNFGATWSTNNSTAFPISYTVASSADGTHLAAAGSETLWISTNSGVTWTVNAAISQAGSFWSVASSADGSTLAVGTTAGPILTSTNSGVTWSEGVTNGAYWYALASSADGTHLAAAPLGLSIYTSTNSGATWSDNNNSPNSQWEALASSADGSHLVAGISGGLIYTSTNSGVTWSHNNNAPPGNWDSAASSADGTHLVAAISPGLIYTSTDSGVTWSGNNNAPVANWNSVASSADGSRLVAADFKGQVWNSGPVYPGAPGTTVQFQYLGNGVWQTVSVAGSQIIGTIPVSTLPSSVVMNGESGVTLSGTFSGNGSGLTTLNSTVVTNTQSGVTLSGTFSGNGSGLTSLNSTVVTNTESGVSLSGSFAGNHSGNGSGLTSLNTSNLVGTLPAPNFAATTVTNFPDVSGPLPTNFVFTSHGGRLLITAYGTGYPSSQNMYIGIIVQLDGTIICTNQIYGNYIIHLPFGAKTVVRNNVSAGPHTLTLSALPGTTTDNNDFYSATVQELPY